MTDNEKREAARQFYQKLVNRGREYEDETLRIIRDSRNGIGLSKAYNSVDDLMEDLNADD